MSGATLAPDAPYKLEMQVMLVGVSGPHKGYTAWASIDLPPGKGFTDQEVQQRLANAAEAAGEHFRLAGRHEFLQELLSEQSGIAGAQFAAPGPDSFRLTAPEERRMEIERSREDEGDE